MMVLLKNVLIQADSSDAPLSSEPDGFWTLAEYFPVTGTKQCEEKALPWVLDYLDSFDLEDPRRCILDEISKPSSQR